MRQQANHSYESEGFHAHNFLSKAKTQPRWKYRVASRVIQTLASSTDSWKEARTVPLAKKEADTSKPEQLSFDFSLEKTFQTLADEWSAATEHMSNIIKASTYPAYQQIIGMGKVAPSIVVPLILRELERRPDHWFWALNEITKEDPVQPDANFQEAVQAWLLWGKRKGYLT